MSFDPFCLALLFVRSGAMQRRQSSSKLTRSAFQKFGLLGVK